MVEQIEQDLLLSRLIVEIANDDYLGDELVFRGGTCLHKLHAPEPLRYSGDLDYVRSAGGGIRDLTRAVTQIGDRLGMDVRTRITEHPKMFLGAPYETDGQASGQRPSLPCASPVTLSLTSYMVSSSERIGGIIRGRRVGRTPSALLLSLGNVETQ